MREMRHNCNRKGECRSDNFVIDSLRAWRQESREMCLTKTSSMSNWINFFLSYSSCVLLTLIRGSLLLTSTSCINISIKKEKHNVSSPYFLARNALLSSCLLCHERSVNLVDPNSLFFSSYVSVWLCKHTVMPDDLEQYFSLWRLKGLRRRSLTLTLRTQKTCRSQRKRRKEEHLQHSSNSWFFPGFLVCYDCNYSSQSSQSVAD